MLNTKLRNLFVGTVTLAAVLAGCSMSPDPPVATEAPSPSVGATDPQPDATTTPEASPPGTTDGYVDAGYGLSIPAGGPGECTGTAVIYIASTEGKTIAEVLLPENLIDMGPREFAKGEVEYDDQGRVATYTVAAGDVLGTIGERFCSYDGGMIGQLNGYKGYESIHPGDVLVLNPQAVPGFEYKDPYT